MAINIRKAKLSDFDAIIHLNSLLFKNDFQYDKTLDLNWSFGKESEKYFKEGITNSNHCTLVAESSGKILGYLAGGLRKRKTYTKPAKYAELENMLVLEKFRNQGVGGKLVEVFLEWCKKQNIDYLDVTASASNKQGIDFYKKHGFEEYDLVLERKLKK